MHYIKHNSLGFHTGRWYKIEERRWVQFTIGVENSCYRLIINKGYGHPTGSEKPRATTQIVNEIRDNLKAIEKLFDGHVKKYMYWYPEFQKIHDKEYGKMIVQQLRGV